MEQEKKPLISVIIPVYNAAAYLPECLDSLLAQDLPEEDYEILCVNDGSTDGSPALLEDYARRHGNVRPIHKENGGVTTARNLGLEQAKGEFIWFVDADDRVRANILSRLWQKVKERACDRLVFGAYTFTDTLTEAELAGAETGSLPCNVPWWDAVVWRCLLRREFLLERNLTFRYPELTHGEDGLFLYEVGLEGPVTAELDETVYFYRIHSGSAETSISPQTRRRKLSSYLRLVEILKGYYDGGKKDSATANKLMSFLWMALYEAARLPKEQAAPALEKLGQLGLYPSRRLPECNLQSAYLISAPGVLGKVLDGICQNLQRPWGYAALRLLMKVKG